MTDVKSIIVIVTFLVFISQRVIASDDDLIVSTSVGQIRGLRASDGNYRMFMGIPYAIVNESNPFGPSSPFPKFEEEFAAYDDSAICPQLEEFNSTLAGALDCLHVNVYVPDTATTERLPVLVWIYGGRFEIGFAGRYIHGPRFLVRHDIILVTLNYRVGPFGFMCLDIPEVPGNQGLKDQLLALKWVKNNIEAFGGDADKITIFGESAGGMSIDLHLLSDHEKLYDKAILQSGTALSPAFFEPLRQAPITIANHLNFETNNLHEAITYLASVQPHAIVAAIHELDIQLRFRPCIEKKFDGVQNFMDVDWFKVYKMPKVENMSFLMGFTNEETLLNYIFLDSEYFKNSNIVENLLHRVFDVDHEDFSGMKEVMHNFYFGDGELDDSMRWQAIDFHSDLIFVHPTHRSLRRYLDNVAEKVYLYKFSYVGERNFVKQRLNVTIGGAAHADELGYLFDVSYLPESNAEDKLVIDRMTTLWANFVKYNDPTPETSELLSHKWQPITNGSQYHYLTIDAELDVGTRPFNDRMAFWDLFYKANYDLQRVYPESIVEDTDSAANNGRLNLFLIVSSILNLIINYY